MAGDRWHAKSQKAKGKSRKAKGVLVRLDFHSTAGALSGEWTTLLKIPLPNPPLAKGREWWGQLPIFIPLVVRCQAHKQLPRGESHEGRVSVRGQEATYVTVYDNLHFYGKDSCASCYTCYPGPRGSDLLIFTGLICVSAPGQVATQSATPLLPLLPSSPHLKT